MAYSFNRKYVKLAVNYTAISLLVWGVVCFLLGLGMLIDAGTLSSQTYGNPYSQEMAAGFSGLTSKILASGILQIIGGLLLLVGIIQGRRIPVLGYLIFGTIGLLIATCYGLYGVAMFYKGSRSITSMMMIFIAIFLFAVSWWCHFCIFYFYKDLEQERWQRHADPTAAPESAPLSHNDKP